MALNLDAIGSVSDPVERSWSSKDALLYALAVGAGTPSATSELSFTTENTRGVEQKVLPTFGVVLALGAGRLTKSIGTFNPAMAVHAEQTIDFHRTISPEGSVVITSRLVDIEDKRSGALIITESSAVDRSSSAPVFTTRSGLFVRGEGGFGSASAGDTQDRSQSIAHRALDRRPDHEVTYGTLPQQALFYRLCGDRNPLHSDPSFAERAGFERPILHGLCTYGFTGRAILHSLCGSDPSRLRSMYGRFSKPVRPGQSLTVSIWLDEDGKRASFRTTTEDGVVVIDRGRCSISCDRNEPVIVATARSPIGRANKGSLVDVRADELMATVLRAALDKLPALDRSEIVDVVCGNVAQTGEAGFSIARAASILAGLPITVPGLTLNRFCASSLQSIRTAAHAIQAGEGEIYVACGVEKTSKPPKPEGSEENRGARGGFQIGPGGLNPRLLGNEGGLPFLYMPMGMTAEKVARKYQVSRKDQDGFAKRSQDRAVAAQDAGFFDWEITPIVKADGTLVAADDGPRRDTTLEGLAELKPAFRPDGGTVTAGNSCPLNDGAAAVVLMSHARANELGIAPLARIVSSAVSANAPEYMGVAPIDAIPKALAAAGMTISDIDVVELNEAFAAQVLPVCEATGIDMAKLNPHGGAIALGHPFGMTGARIMGTLINDLRVLDGTHGLEAMCAAGGMAMAMVIERLS